MMEDDVDLSRLFQLELMHALQNRRPLLRPLPPEEIPSYIGGFKATFHHQQRRDSPAPDFSNGHQLTPLQREFLQSSKLMQNRLRPRFQVMQDLQNRILEDERQFRMLAELRTLFRNSRKGSGHQPDTAFEVKSPESCRMLYQFERLSDNRPGWRQLQEELRSTCPRGRLKPVETDNGFYVINLVPSPTAV